MQTFIMDIPVYVWFQIEQNISIENKVNILKDWLSN